VAVIDVRNTTLRKVAEGVSLGGDFKSDIIDFKEMNNAFLQAVTTSAPDALDGVFSLVVSLLCEDDTFVPYPDSERTLNADCNNFGWHFCCVPFRYARVCYTANSVTTGTVDIYARAKRT
jgi:hypothetical protein